MTYFAPKVDQAVADKDAAETFAEPDLSLTHTNTLVDNESIALAGGESTADVPAYSNATGTSGEYGVEIEITKRMQEISYTLSANTSGLDEVVLHLPGGGIQTVSPGTAFTDGPYEPGVYAIAGNESSGELWTVSQLIGPELPIESEYVDINAAYDNGSTNDLQLYTFSSVSVSAPVQTSGSITVEWPMPPDNYSWDVGVFQASPDGETVDVFVEEQQSGGWTTIAGPIQRGDSLPADPSNNVRYRVEISRADTANNPTLDAIYRRFKL